MAERPRFLSLIIVILIMYSIFVLIFGLMIMFMTDDIVKIFTDMELDTDWLTGTMGVFSVLMGVLVLIMSCLLWKGVKTDWYLVLILLTAYAIMAALTAFPYGLILTVVLIIPIWYFLRPDVKEFFGIRTDGKN